MLDERPLGGTETAVVELAAALAERGDPRTRHSDVTFHVTVPGDPHSREFGEAFVAAAAGIRSDSALWARCSNAGRARATAELDWGRVAEGRQDCRSLTRVAEGLQAPIAFQTEAEP